ncbi:hypothetical protein Mgra_00000477 [Meloidogyne graminicola]|uniref:Uncharacterized protein n=1 Tax=Meloidogyne graminicola TaxID=189291 RepID=A0A8T0A3B4_9BILA|nr:hypothetical protein Mgra_00000477 [Meloidogyne graminicola]
MYNNNNSKIIFSSFYFYLLLILIGALPGIKTRTINNSNENNIFLFQRNQRNNEEINNQNDNLNCNVYDNDQLHVLMDRICELCHDMFSHQLPNTRAECRSDCFRSNNFKKCLRLFKPINTKNK